ncbi:MAG: helix-turn-helix transcriptional regulator [Oscillospiraceae bacterium]|nr:helix-turn-helix transcriptional regulator [Oscillospiraceae bacterium]
MGSVDNEKNLGAALEENLKKALTELVMLYLLSKKDRYIGELTELIKRRSKGTLTIAFPYSSIYRLLQAGYIRETEKRYAPDGRRRQFYFITAIGREHLNMLLSTYRLFIGNIETILKEEDRENDGNN